MLSSAETFTYTFDSPQRQYFSLPSVCITYLLDYPKYPRNLLKIYGTCKYFYSKRPILCILNDAEYQLDFVSILNSRTAIPLKNLKATLWFDKYLILRDVPKLTNIFRCTLKELSLSNTTLLLSEFSKLVNGNTIFHFYTDCSPAQYSDGTDVSMDVILQMLPNLIRLYYYDKKEKYSTAMLEKCANIKFWNKFSLCGFFVYSNDFDPKLLYKFIANNAEKTIQVPLFFGSNVMADKKAALKFLFNKFATHLKVTANW